MKTLLGVGGLTLCLLAQNAYGRAIDEMSEGSLPPGKQFSSPSPGDPTQGTREQAVGFYSRGKLANSNQLPLEGKGFTKILRPRDRAFATYDLIQVLRKAAATLQKEHPSRDRMQIGDIAARHGGSLIPAHASHQNGLDVDIAYIRADGTEQDPNGTDGFEESFVKDGRLTGNFDMPRNWSLMKAFVATGRVNRMFVNEVMKKAFCDHARQTGELESAAEVLRRLRPYEGHMDHVHLRLTCPHRSPNCTQQEEVPEGTGCS